MRDLPIHEHFYAWQGEGVHCGRAAYFIRTFGCPVQCAWCDAAGTWHPDYIPKNVPRIPPEVLAAEAAGTAAEFAVITGGEPAIHDLEPLTDALAGRGLTAHLETSGAFPLRGNFGWVTVSPKWARLPRPEVLARADEIKIIVEQVSSIADWWQQIGTQVATRHVWLHPEWSRRKDPAILQAISGWIKAHGAPFRAGYQIHKPYRVDQEDPRSRPATPLGGDPGLGY